MTSQLQRMIGLATVLAGFVIFGFVASPAMAQTPVPTVTPSATNQITLQQHSVTVITTTLYGLTGTIPTTVTLTGGGKTFQATVTNYVTQPVTLTVLIDSVAGGGTTDTSILHKVITNVLASLAPTDAFTVAVADFQHGTKPDQFAWAPQTTARGFITGLLGTLQLHVFTIDDERTHLNDTSFTALYDLAAKLQGDGYFLILVTNGLGLRYRPLHVPSVMVALKETTRATYLVSGPADLAVTNYISSHSYYTLGNPSLAGFLAEHLARARPTILQLTYPTTETTAITAVLSLVGQTAVVSLPAVPATPALPTPTALPATPTAVPTHAPLVLTPTVQPLAGSALTGMLPFMIGALIIVVCAVLLIIVVFTRRPRRHAAPVLTSSDSGQAASKAATAYLRADLGSASDKGQQREMNEDTLGMATRGDPAQPITLLIVSDGMGGVDAGEVASALTVKSLKQSFTGEQNTNINWNDWMQQAIQSANEQVISEAKKRNAQMGATVVIAVIDQGTAYLGSVGDSRIYRWNPNRDKGQLTRLTTDHSVVQRLVELGQLSDDERYIHPDRNVVLRSLGDERTGKSDVIPPVLLSSGDWLLLCTDGLWEMVHDPAMQDILAHASSAQEACDRLVGEANKNGGEDNITALIAHFVS